MNANTSEISHRVLIEKLFTEFVSFYKSDKEFKAAVDKELVLKSNWLKNLQSNDPKMTMINLVMNEIPIQSLFFTMKNYPLNTILPKFSSSSNILYGSLSEIVHNPDLQSIIISSDLREEWKSAYQKIGDHFQTNLIEYDPIMAAAGGKDAQLNKIT
jgi:hypothetical protein